MMARIAILSVSILMALTLPQGTAQASDYILTIDGVRYEIRLGEEAMIRLAGDRSIRVQLDKAPTSTFRTTAFSFEHPSSYSPSRTDLGDGIHQTMVSSPVGTVVLIQEYQGLDPSSLVDMMLNELTKEERQYGYNITEASITKTLSDGRVLTGEHSVSTYQDTTIIRDVLAYGARDAGLLVISIIPDTAPPLDLQMVDMVWSTLRVLLR